jgi:endonuclease/exonuclease/phosphatase family metal-dependent hydrolase
MGTINVTWWNLQNFFDTDDDPISKDFEYTAAKGWTQEIFGAKKANLAQALKATHNGKEVELLAVAEIEKDSLLKELINEMEYSHLKVIEDPTGTSDLRGIDVAVAYDDRKLRVKSKASHLVHLRYRTRDIFEVVFEVNDTGETLVIVASHWPSRVRGKYRTEPLRIAVAEHIAYLVETHVKVEPQEYEDLRAQNDLSPVREKWETKVMVMGDFNDEPSDRSVVDHLRASNDLDRVIGRTNDIDGFKKETADYRAQEVFLFNAAWKFLPQQKVGTYFLDALRSGEKFANRYQVLDQFVATRGLLTGSGLTLDVDSVAIFRELLVATGSGRPRGFNKKKKRGTSDHLPLTVVLRY